MSDTNFSKQYDTITAQDVYRIFVDNYGHPQMEVGGAVLQRSLLNTELPVILAPNGTIATNGTVTLGTALPVIFPKAWVYFPAGAVSGGSAGMYYVVFSSTTVGQVYTNFADASAAAFVPTTPIGTPVAAVGSNSAYTQTTGSDVVLMNLTIAANLLGINGKLGLEYLQEHNNSAGTKTAKVKLGATIYSSNAVTTSVYGWVLRSIRNVGVTNAQVSTSVGAIGPIGSSATAVVRSTIDTTTVQQLYFTGQLATATDFLLLTYAGVVLTPSD